MQFIRANPEQLTLVYDVSDVSLVRKRIGLAATSMKIIGFLSSIDVILSPPARLRFAVALMLGLIVLWFAWRVANGMRSGRMWAFTVAAVWCGLWAYFVILDALPKSLRAGIGFFNTLGLTIFMVPLYFLVRGLLAWREYRVHIAARTDLPDPLARDPWEFARPRSYKRPKFMNKRSMAAYVFLVLTPIPWIVFLLSTLNSTVPS